MAYISLGCILDSPHKDFGKEGFRQGALYPTVGRRAWDMRPCRDITFSDGALNDDDVLEDAVSKDRDCSVRRVDRCKKHQV